MLLQQSIARVAACAIYSVIDLVMWSLLFPAQSADIGSISNLHIISIFIPSFCCLYLSWKPAVPFLSIAHLSVLKQVRLKPSSSADPYYHRCREVSRRKGHRLCHLTTCGEHWRRTANILLVQLRERLTHWESLLSFFCCLKKRNQERRQHIKQGRVLLNSTNKVMASVEKLIKWE